MTEQQREVKEKRNFLAAVDKYSYYLLLLFLPFFIYFAQDEFRRIYYSLILDSKGCKAENPPPPGHVWIDDNVSIPQVFKGKACSSKDEEQGVCIDALILKGKISHATKTEMQNALAHYKDDVQAVCLASTGGLMAALPTLYDDIRFSGLATCMAEHYVLGHDTDVRISEDINRYTTAGNCSSACSFLLYASEQRIALGKDFEVRVHLPGEEYCIAGKKKRVNLHFSYQQEDMMKVLNYVKKTSSLGVPAELVDEFHQLVISRPFSEKDLLPINVDKAFELKIFNANETSPSVAAQP